MWAPWGAIGPEEVTLQVHAEAIASNVRARRLYTAHRVCYLCCIVLCFATYTPCNFLRKQADDLKKRRAHKLEQKCVTNETWEKSPA